MGSLARRQKFDSLEEALQVLDDAAEKSAQEVKDMIINDYKHLTNAVRSVKPEVKSALSTVGDRTSEMVRDTAENVTEFTRNAAEGVDRQVKEHPWWYIGGAAVAAGLLGYIFARK